MKETAYPPSARASCALSRGYNGRITSAVLDTSGFSVSVETSDFASVSFFVFGAEVAQAVVTAVINRAPVNKG